MTLKVAIVGRPNVGKSTLFNRLVGKKLALVHDLPGVTRDRKEAETKYKDLSLKVIDTAGYEEATAGKMEERMWQQTRRAIEESDVVLFLYDARAGIQAYDEHFADLVRKSKKPVILLANKCEGKAQELGVYEAYKLGLGEPLIFSAEHSIGFDELYLELKDYEQKLATATAKTAEEKEEELLKRKDIMKLFRVTKQTVCRWVKRGVLREHRMGNIRYYLKNEVFEDLKKNDSVRMTGKIAEGLYGKD